jgi:hypothetical protein
MPSGGPSRKKSSDAFVVSVEERALHLHTDMLVTLDGDQTEVLREILEQQLRVLRVESARSDTHDYREKLHRRERIVEAMLDQLAGAASERDIHVTF